MSSFKFGVIRLPVVSCLSPCDLEIKVVVCSYRGRFCFDEGNGGSVSDGSGNAEYLFLQKKFAGQHEQFNIKCSEHCRVKWIM